MVLLLDIVRDFSKACREVVRETEEFKPLAEQLISMAQNHERRPLMLQNLCQQIARYEKAFGVKANARDRAKMIKAVAHMFIHAIKQKRDRDDWSAARKSQELNKNSLKNDVAQLIREVPHGETQEENRPRAS